VLRFCHFAATTLPLVPSLQKVATVSKVEPDNGSWRIKKDIFMLTTISREIVWAITLRLDSLKRLQKEGCRSNQGGNGRHRCNRDAQIKCKTTTQVAQASIELSALHAQDLLSAKFLHRSLMSYSAYLFVTRATNRQRTSYSNLV